MILWIFFTEINSSKTTMDNSGRMLVRVVTRAIRDKLPEVMASEAWVWLPEGVIMELLEDSSLQVTEGQLFDGIVNWCRANTALGRSRRLLTSINTVLRRKWSARISAYQSG